MAAAATTFQEARAQFRSCRNFSSNTIDDENDDGDMNRAIKAICSRRKRKMSLVLTSFGWSLPNLDSSKLGSSSCLHYNYSTQRKSRCASERASESAFH